ncbi:PREDICTED: phosphatidylglycerol/phosphatidylinositol transfer protein-like isoform X1 [Ipomoea nil]|uniref:phosphatidylglycerol/phosphatidylinositol transfer protein-like isoform X1 n=1 Tax=Ipomoea nil TaxID=35883 RepID=UPI0009011E9C|nr:PREDICTED: phosphatidylglycerol/phosphatidylinositol transfer protein-like isoform X1 [Ipomoea nil]
MAELKFIVVLVLSLCAIFPLSSATSNDFQYCSKKKNYDVKVTGVDITPSPVQRSVDTTFSIAASTDKSISSGKLTVEVKYFFFSVYSEDHDLCSETSCPIPAGDFVIAHTQALPGYTPPVRLLSSSSNLVMLILMMPILHVLKAHLLLFRSELVIFLYC